MMSSPVHGKLIASALVTTTLLLTLLSSSAIATTLLKLSMNDLVDKSEAIVHGEVIELTPIKENGRIYTYIALDVKEQLKGASTERVEFRVLGGRIDDLVTIVHGSPNFALGEEVLVFLERPVEDKPLVVTGMVQGKFSIAIGPDQKTPYLVPQLGGTPLVERQELIDESGTLRKRLKEASPASVHAQVTELSAVKTSIRQRISSQR